MSTVPTQIRIDRDIKEQAGILFSGLGLDMSGAVNMFLHQCVLRGGIPFSVEMPHYKQSTLAAMDEARKISRDPNVPSYDNMDELKRALEE
ncbi:MULTISPECIES: type II toxin-antitoxin system RelB/DinJ family antitoxin [Selenomonas]|uniref:type II toxin-antitoxin system RelB/DinJ family antitoxin n=1 Tax=Selenomonas TaxID=970 RepID=UPI0002E0B36D|nr:MULTISPECIES: type II toxin-antitoxin system RelB/DinJ family antitoxin [Selenomonas]UZE46027.1 type II toxin-antitoxin system RelB/DinJ family antitoxin [Selenomonas sputigena]